MQKMWLGASRSHFSKHVLGISGLEETFPALGSCQVPRTRQQSSSVHTHMPYKDAVQAGRPF